MSIKIEKKIKYITALLFLIFADVYSLSKAPTTPLFTESSKPVIQFEFYDVENRQIIYDTVPVLVGTRDKGILSIQPYLSKNVVTGFTDLQFWLSHYPVFNTPGCADTVDAQYVSISTVKRSIRFPLIFKQFVSATGTNKIVSGQISDAQEKAYVQLFPEDIEKLQLLILDTERTPILPWEPQNASQKLAELRGNRIEMVSSSRQIQELKNYNIEMSNKIANSGYSSNKNTSVFVAPSPYEVLAENDSIIMKQRSAVITLHGSKGKKRWSLTSDKLWMLLDIIDLYQQMNGMDPAN
ncbi:MAG: hypothetical protein ACRCTQ_05490 [Brevinemataceae bacterium]